MGIICPFKSYYMPILLWTKTYTRRLVTAQRRFLSREEKTKGNKT
jgi:hypothetical protein